MHTEGSCSSVWAISSPWVGRTVAWRGIFKPIATALRRLPDPYDDLMRSWEPSMANIAITSAEEGARTDVMRRVYERGGSQCIDGRSQISTVPIAGFRPHLGRKTNLYLRSNSPFLLSFFNPVVPYSLRPPEKSLHLQRRRSRSYQTSPNLQGE